MTHWAYHKKRMRAAQNISEGHMRPAGWEPTYVLHCLMLPSWLTSWALWSLFSYSKNPLWNTKIGRCITKGNGLWHEPVQSDSHNRKSLSILSSHRCPISSAYLLSSKHFVPMYISSFCHACYMSLLLRYFPFNHVLTLSGFFSMFLLPLHSS